ncbi:filamin-A-interacting protein 1 [Clarias gariepinus]|uniref:filamin-A-interacting protein 1 n=1 Tax=Clarias gariepinus TaxID=13013 RepID=UPI00234CEEC0|nr:filamin-A-interacting protein 1 [Clarias gariepinus]XP_053366513.1 filamin-A-interacting protein 1 [Clarias gariepinus]XP_053366514.1 filamin-A-interacting protein 1 [Clarias gariepinus]
MRSKGDGIESPANGVLVVPHAIHELREEQEEDMKVQVTEISIKAKVQQKKKEEMLTSENEDKSTMKDNQRLGLKDLSKDDLLKLLEIMEGEIQGLEDVIRVLKSGLSCPGRLESYYSSACPTKPLKALQRDRLLINNHTLHEDVYEKPMAELDRLQNKHKEAYRRMLEQLLLAEKCHRRVVHELDVEKHKHVDYMNKSDDFTNLLEQERERLKQLLKQEKAYQLRKEKEHSKQLEKVRGELNKVKSFALMLVDEQQLQLEQIDQQSQQIQDLLKKLQEKEQKLSEVEIEAKEDKQKLMNLGVEFEVKNSNFAQRYDEMTAKLASQESQYQQMCQKQATLSQKIEELEETNAILQKSAEELQELRDKISKGQCGKSSLMAQLENLQKIVLEMEGKDEELTKTENKCSELKRKLQVEEINNKELKLEVEKLQKRMMELQKLEAAFNMGRTECARLQGALDKEKGLAKQLEDELMTVKIRMKEVESSELKLEKTELLLKEELIKLKSVTVMMVSEHKDVAERVRSEEKKREELEKLFKAEQEKVMVVTERLIEESKRLLKLKSEMEEKITTLVKEKNELKEKLSTEKERYKGLSPKVCIIKHIGDEVKEEGKGSTNQVLNKDVGNLSNSRTNDEKIIELTREIEILRKRLKQLEVVEGDLIKTEDEYDMLEKKFKSEQERANSLSKQVEEMRNKIALSKVLEREETVGQELELRRRCKLEETKNKDLQADVQALKEKIHELMNKEDQLSQIQVKYSVLQQKFLEQEDKRKSMSNEVLNLTKELEITKRYSRALRPNSNGRRMIDVPMTSTGVQTDIGKTEAGDDDDDTPAVFIKKSVQEENHIMNSLRQRSLKKPPERPSVRELYPPPANDLTLKKSWIPWMKKKENHASEKPLHISEEITHSEIKMTQKQGQPLHIRLTPDHQNSRTTLEIGSSPAENNFSTAIPTPSCGAQKPQITIIPSTAISPNPKELKCQEREKSPLTITAISRAKSPESIKIPSINRPTSPISLIPVSNSSLAHTSSSPESQGMITERAVFKVTPEKRMVPAPIKKCNTNANIITTEDNKIHIHLGSQVKKPFENNSSMVMVRADNVANGGKELSTGTVLRSPRHSTISKQASSKVTSSLTITQVTPAPPRPTLSVQPIVDPQPSRSGLTRIPMSRGMKTGKAVLGALGIPSNVKMEAKTEGQSMRIELKKPSISSATLQNSGKS